MKLKELFEAPNPKIPAVRDLPPIDANELISVIDKVRKSKVYKELMMYARDVTHLSKTREKNGTLTILFNNGMDEYYIYSNGQIRKYAKDRMTLVTSPVPDADLYTRYINCISVLLEKAEKPKPKKYHNDIVEISSPSIISLKEVQFPETVNKLIIHPSCIKLKSLEGCPEVESVIACNAKGIESLVGLPSNFNNQIKLSNLKIKSFDGIPVGTKFLSINECNNIKSFKDFNLLLPNLQELYINHNVDSSNILSILKIKKLKDLKFVGYTINPDSKSYKAFTILAKYIQSKDILACQDELIENGLKEYAKF